MITRNSNKLLACFNKIKVLVSSRCQSEFSEAISSKRLEHYRSLNALEDTDAKPGEWNNARPFESIPGPQPLPFVGNTWRFMLPKVGTFFGLDFVEIMKMLHNQYGDITILKGLFNRNPLVFLFNAKDVEMLHRNEGLWPIRNGLLSFKEYRKSREHILPNGGLITHQGENWFKFRSLVNPILMQPKNVMVYVDKMNLIADELIDNIRYFSEQNEEGEMPTDFQNELYKWALESVGVVAMDTRLGCLNRDAEKSSESQKLIENVMTMFELMYKLDVLPTLPILSTLYWKKYYKVLDFLMDTNLKLINQSLERMEQYKDSNNSVETSVLQKLVKKDKNVALVMTLDMMIAGIDTTGRVLSAALYFLSKNPEKQQRLRLEAFSLLKNKDSPVTKEVLSKANYLRAVIKEVTRLAPIAIGNLRMTVKDLVLGGYQIPKGTEVLAANLMMCRKDEHFPEAAKFLPERWLSSTTTELSHKNTNPFVFAPFGNGARSCIGKRLANLELETALLKVVRNFELNWPHEDMVFRTTTLHGIGNPLKLHVTSL